MRSVVTLVLWMGAPFLLIPLAVRSPTVRAVVAIVVATFELIATSVTLAAIEDDPQAVLGFLMVPPISAAAIALVGLADRVVSAQRHRRAEPGSDDRIVAVAIDLIVIGLGAVWPMTEAWDGTAQVAVPGAVVVAYFAVGFASGATLGQRALGLRVVRNGPGGPGDPDGRLPLPHAVLRAVVVALEVAAAFVLPLAWIPLMDAACSLGDGGRSLGDRLTGSRVVSRWAAEPG